MLAIRETCVDSRLVLGIIFLHFWRRNSLFTLEIIVILGGHIAYPKCGGKSLGCVRQHVRPQQFQTWPKSEKTGPHRR